MTIIEAKSNEGMNEVRHSTEGKDTDLWGIKETGTKGLGRIEQNR